MKYQIISDYHIDNFGLIFLYFISIILLLIILCYILNKIGNIMKTLINEDITEYRSSLFRYCSIVFLLLIELIILYIDNNIPKNISLKGCILYIICYIISNEVVMILSTSIIVTILYLTSIPFIIKVINFIFIFIFF